MMRWRRIWAAGFVDGEGCIHISTGYCLSLTIEQKTSEPLEILKQLFGGSIRERNSDWGVVYRWALMSHDAANALRLLEPYLCVKRKQARVAIRFQSGRRRGVKLDRDVAEEARLKLKQLKRTLPMEIEVAVARRWSEAK